MTHGLTRRSGLLAGAASVLSSAWIRTAAADETGTLTVALSNNPVTCDPINMSSHDSGSSARRSGKTWWSSISTAT